MIDRSGADNIREHADKTLDLKPNAPIVNVSLGSERLMILRPKIKVLYTPINNYNKFFFQIKFNVCSWVVNVEKLLPFVCLFLMAVVLN